MLIRPGTLSDVPQLSRVYSQSWKTTYGGLVPEPFLKGITPEAAASIFTDSLGPNAHSYFLHVAETPQGRLVGFADGGKERSHPEKGVGELYAIYLLKEFQNQGIGRLLFRSSVQSLLQAGMGSMVAWVLLQSPSWKFYEGMGGKRQESLKQLNIGGHSIGLVSYVWENIKDLSFPKEPKS